MEKENVWATRPVKLFISSRSCRWMLNAATWPRSLGHPKVCGRPFAIPCRTFQRFDEQRFFPNISKDRFHHSNSQEGDSRYVRSQQLQTHFKPDAPTSYLSFLSVRRTNKLFATLTDFNYFQSCSLPTGNIGQPNGYNQGHVRRLRGGRCRLRHSSRPSRPQRRVRHGRPSHSTRLPCAWLRYQGAGHSVDRVIPHGTQSIRAVQRGHLKDCTSNLRRATRVRPGADPFYLLLGRSRRHRSASGLQIARVRRQPTNIRIDGSERCCWSYGSNVALHRVCRVMDELKSTPAQSIKNRVDMARHE